jgi:hypothetical protein
MPIITRAQRAQLQRLLGVGSLRALRHKWISMPQFNQQHALRQIGALR